MAPLSNDRLALLRAALAEKGLAAPRSAALPRRANPERAPLSWAQERLYFLELFQPGTALYNDAVRVSIEGELDVPRLERALARIVARHEILRTTFVLAGDGPEQRIHPPGPLDLRRIDLDEDPGDAPDLERRALELARAEAREPFDLERAPPWRLCLTRLAPGRWQLVLTMHHILSDGASMGCFFGELTRFHAADEATALEPLPVQFGDYAAWERATTDERRIAADLVHWRHVLGARPAGESAAASALAPFATARGPASQLGAQAPLSFDAHVVGRLEALARRTRTTSNQLLLAAWFALLAEATGTTELRTGIAKSLRQRRELETLIGFFVQSLPLRVDAAGDPSFLELARRVRDASLEADAHASPPFDRIARAVEPEALPGTTPTLVRGFFSHMKDALRAPVFAGTRTSWEFVDPGVARFELALVLHESAEGLSGFLEYDLGVFAPESATRLAEDYGRLLGALLERPEQRLSEAHAPLPSATRGPQRRAPRLRRASGG